MEESADDSDAESAEEDDENNKGEDLANMLQAFITLEPESKAKVKALEELSLKGTIEQIAVACRQLCSRPSAC